MCIHKSVQVRAPFYKCEIVCVCVCACVCVRDKQIEFQPRAIF